LSTHWRVLQETVALYRLTVLDREEAIRDIARDDALVKAADEAAAAAKAAAAGPGAEAAAAATATKPQIDVVQLLEQVKARNPQLFEDLKKVRDVGDAVKLVVDNQDEVRRHCRHPSMPFCFTCHTLTVVCAPPPPRM
jgi:hypothetical protein